MNNLYFLIGYNNYYNRKLKRSANLRAYLNEAKSYIELPNCLNFTPGDGVNTTHVLNDLGHLSVTADVPNYMILTDDAGNIQQRWFVIDCNRTRSGQYFCQLHRDVLVETYDAWKEAPVFVEKAILNNKDSAIFNHENMTFSQIKKTKDDLITDKTGIPWIVGYGNFKNITDVTTWGSSSSQVPTSAELVNINELRELYSEPAKEHTSYGNIYTTACIDGGYNVATFSYKGSISTSITDLPGDEYDELKHHTYGLFSNWSGQNVQAQLKSRFDAAVLGSGGFDQIFRNMQIGEQSEVRTYLEVDNKYYKDIDSGLFYKGIVTRTPVTRKQRLYSYEPGYWQLYEAIKNVPDAINGMYLNAERDRSQAFEFDVSLVEYSVRFESVGQMGGTIDFRSARELNDAPYSMFFMPYGDTYIHTLTSGTIAWGSKTTNMMTATGIAQALKESGYIYDIQVLPYCPVQNFVTYHGEYIVPTNKLDVRTVYNQEGYPETYIAFAEQSSGKFTPSLIIDDTYKLNKKTTYETTKMRLCSPNQTSIFEFSPTMNSDWLEFDVEYTYKPYSPYIHIHPKFAGMYGLDQPEDQRGLVCSGDFSIDMVNDQWATYQLNNVNYQRAFDREISSMELRNEYSRNRELDNAFANVLGAAQGISNNPLTAGTNALAVAGRSAEDIFQNEVLRNDTLDLKNDMFGYALGNIQARPLTLSKLSGFNINSRYMPYIEYYECTDEEFKALERKIMYNGMTVMRIDTPSNFFGNRFVSSEIGYSPFNYFKGQLIQLELDGEDYHFVNTIADELNKGVYIPVGGI